MYYSTDQCQKTIQNTSRITLGNSLRIRHIKKPSLLCPLIATGAKQGWFPYIIDNVAFTQKSPARDLYAIREKRHRNTGAYQTTHQPRPLPCNTLTTKYLQMEDIKFSLLRLFPYPRKASIPDVRPQEKCFSIARPHPKF